MIWRARRHFCPASISPGSRYGRGFLCFAAECLVAAEPDLTKRRALGVKDDFVVDKLDHAFSLATAIRPPHVREMSEAFARMSVGRAARSWMDLCRIVLADDEDEFVGPRGGTPMTPPGRGKSVR